MSQLLQAPPVCQRAVLRIISETLELDGNNYIGYGIEVYSDEERLLLIRDVTCDLQWMEEFVEKINENDVPVMHIMDILIDLLP